MVAPAKLQSQLHQEAHFLILQRLVESSDQPAWITGGSAHPSAGRVLYANRAFLGWLGLDVNHVIARPVREFFVDEGVTPSRLHPALDVWPTATRRGRAALMDSRGAVVDAEWDEATYRDPEDRPSFQVTFFRPVRNHVALVG